MNPNDIKVLVDLIRLAPGHEDFEWKDKSKAIQALSVKDFKMPEQATKEDLCYLCSEPAKHGVRYCMKHYPEFVETVNQSVRMKEWIEGLETNFKYGNHNRGDLIRYIAAGETDEDILYREPNDYITLDGSFTIKQLKALIQHMEKHQ